MSRHEGSPKLSPKPNQDVRILLVDDEADFRNILGLTFKKKGYQVLFASNGREAFDLVKTQPVDVVISDIQMPGGDGIEFLDRTREHHLETPVVLLVTGFADITTEEAHNKGAEALFSKPFDLKTLEQAIARLLTPKAQRWTPPADRVDAEFKIKLEYNSIPSAVEAKVINIGRGGIFVTLAEGQYPNVNDQVSFKIAFGENENLLGGAGIVRWIRTHRRDDLSAGCGIEFTHLMQPELEEILKFIEEQKSKAYIPNR